jgi:hypothetical protein
MKNYKAMKTKVALLITIFTSSLLLTAMEESIPQKSWVRQHYEDAHRKYEEFCAAHPTAVSRAKSLGVAALASAAAGCGGYIAGSRRGYRKGYDQGLLISQGERHYKEHQQGGFEPYQVTYPPDEIEDEV